MENRKNIKKIIETTLAPVAIGAYSQAVVVHKTVYLSGQIPLNSETMQLVEGGVEAQTRQVFQNLAAVCDAAGGNLNQLVKITIYLIDLAHFAQVNTIMAEFFSMPYPARATIQVSALPKNAEIEIDGVLVLE